MEFQEVARRRRMVRRYDVERGVPAEVVEQILENALRAPSAGFAQGFGFLVLDTQDDVARSSAVRFPRGAGHGDLGFIGDPAAGAA